MEQRNAELIKHLHQAQTFLFGNFTLKSGQKSPIYIDLRGLISVPSLLKLSVSAIWNATVADGIEFDCICGVPYAALPLATGVCMEKDIPMLMRRKELKGHGRKKAIEGIVCPGQKCLIVEDVVTEGTSIVETVQVLRSHGLVVQDAVVLLNRQQGAEAKLQSHGITLHSALVLDEVLNYMIEIGEMTCSKKKDIWKSLQDKSRGDCTSSQAKMCWSIRERVESVVHPKAKHLLQLIEEKQSNLCVAADLTSSDQILELARLVGPSICILKIHVDILSDFSSQFVGELKKVAQHFNFLLMEDRKYSDIGNTVRNQFSGGLYKVADWADFVTVHSVSGPGVIDALRQSCNCQTGIFLVAEMSSKGNLCQDDYTKRTVQMAEDNRDIVVGFVCQTRCSTDPAFIYVTPGINTVRREDTLGQSFRSPREAICQGLSDIVIVGRGIYQSSDSASVTKKYREEAFQALTSR